MHFIKCLVSLCFMFAALNAVAQTSVTAIALFKDRAMLSIDGEKAKIVRSGNEYKGIKLISSNTSEAVIEINGKREVLMLNGSTTISDELGSFSQNSRTVVELREGETGFFETQGTVNGRRINFLVDTGANLVVMSSNQANAIGLEYLQGSRTFASTASGNAVMYIVNLDSISVGDIRLQDIQAGVIEGNFPEKPLLGMTFLRELDMTRSGRVMTLEKR